MTYTAFYGSRRISSGTAEQLAKILKTQPQGAVLVFDDSSGAQVDLDLRAENVREPLPVAAPEPLEAEAAPRGRGRPKLGVVAKEVTLLPRHWDWLGVQPGGASVALRKLVDEARRSSGDRDRVRLAQEAAYRFMLALAGNLAGFEEATRALFAYDRRRFTELIAGWPEDLRDYAVQLAFADRT